MIEHEQNGARDHDHLSALVPDDVLEQLDQDITQAGGEWTEPAEYQGAVGRTMFDLPSSEDNTITVLVPKEEISKVPSQSLVRVRSTLDDRHYLGIVVRLKALLPSQMACAAMRQS